MPGVKLLTALALAAMVAAQESPLAREMLDVHNAVRARVHVPPLLWSGQLAAAAQSWADSLLSHGKFSHNPESPYGENLFEIRGGRMNAAQVLNDWASEASNYEYRRNRCRGMCGHYTQIVWRDSSRVGCAVAEGRGRQIWVCEYDPPGNIVGRRPY